LVRKKRVRVQNDPKLSAWIIVATMLGTVIGFKLLVVTNASARAEWVTAGGTAVLALAAVAALAVAVDSLGDARKTRHGQLALELTERWNDQGVRESRKLYTEYRPEGIIALHDKLFADPAKKWDRKDLEETLQGP
jgi:hypothetical protein